VNNRLKQEKKTVFFSMRIYQIYQQRIRYKRKGRYLRSITLIHSYTKQKIVYYISEMSVVRSCHITNLAIFWDVEPCSLYVNRRFGGIYHLHLQGWKSLELYPKRRQHSLTSYVRISSPTWSIPLRWSPRLKLRKLQVELLSYRACI
jgi:hypothetical protein